VPAAAPAATYSPDDLHYRRQTSVRTAMRALCSLPADVSFTASKIPPQCWWSADGDSTPEW